MAQSLSDVLVHVVFSTKNRTPWITPEIRRELYPIMGATLRSSGCVPIQIGGVEDHVHVLVVLPRTMTVAQLVEGLKTPTSKWMKTKGVPGFAWQGGYGAFSVSASQRTVVVAYISEQEEHHRAVSFQDEFRALLKERGIAWDERYVWD